MAHEIENCAYSTDEGKGWHGLGNPIPADAAKDPHRIAALAGATFRVEKRECFYSNPDGSYTQAPNRSVLVRSDNNAMIEVTSSSSYHVANRQPVDIFAAFRDHLAEESLSISHASVLRGGAIIVACAKLNDASFQVGRGDPVNHYLTLTTGYDTAHGTKAMLGSIRVVCANTLQSATSQANANGRATTLKASQRFEHDTLTGIVANIGDILAAERAKFERLANAPMTDADVMRTFADVLDIDISRPDSISTRARNMLSHLVASYNHAPGSDIARGTAWGALNAVTHYATHVKTVRDTKSDGNDSARLASNLFGDSAKVKARALEILTSRYAMAA